jgi:protein farnesyltransferase subunit beta
MEQQCYPQEQDSFSNHQNLFFYKKDMEEVELSSETVKFNDDGFPTDTSDLQQEIESQVLQAQKSSKTLLRKKHIKYLSQSINNSLNKWFVSLDASRPWILYWILHSLSLLDKPADLELKSKTIQTLSLCKHINGGFGGGPGQIAHLATTYAAINTIAIIGTIDAYNLIDTEKLYTFLMEMKQTDGSFRMHHGGEIDIRGTYCALNVAVLCNIITPELLKNCSAFIKKCQSYEGGLGPIPFVEAHGGYTFCGLAAMVLMNKVDELDLGSLTEWVSFRQMGVEGGFQGRTNKLVDGCYSFWQGGAAVLLQIYLNALMDVKLFRRGETGQAENANVTLFGRGISY